MIKNQHIPIMSKEVLSFINGKSKLKNSNGLESILLKLLLEYRNN